MGGWGGRSRPVDICTVEDINLGTGQIGGNIYSVFCFLQCAQRNRIKHSFNSAAIKIKLKNCFHTKDLFKFK